jgi:hypothetical protein
MSTRLLVPVCAVIALISACTDRDNDSGMTSDGVNGTGIAAGESPTAPGTTVTPADMPPTPNDTAPAQAPSSEPPPAENPPANPPQ